MKDPEDRDTVDLFEQLMEPDPVMTHFDIGIDISACGMDSIDIDVSWVHAMSAVASKVNCPDCKEQTSWKEAMLEEMLNGKTLSSS